MVDGRTTVMRLRHSTPKELHQAPACGNFSRTKRVRQKALTTRT